MLVNIVRDLASDTVSFRWHYNLEYPRWANNNNI